MLTRDFLVPCREGIFCLLRREKYSSFCRGNFFLSVECYIPYFPSFPIKFTGKLMEDFWLATGAGQSGHKIRPLRKKFGPFCQIASVKISENSS
jgi:hypothetical protein